MNALEWGKATQITKDFIEKLKTHMATWKPHLDDDSCIDTLLSLEIINISSGNQTISYSCTTEGLSRWPSDKGKPYKYPCTSGYNQEDSTWDDINETFFKRLVWRKK